MPRNGRTYTALRGQLVGLGMALDGIEQSGKSWSDIVRRLREVEDAAVFLKPHLREPIVRQLGQAKGHVEHGNAPLARQALLRAEQSLP